MMTTGLFAVMVSSVRIDRFSVADMQLPTDSGDGIRERSMRGAEITV